MAEPALYRRGLRGYEPANDAALEFWTAGKPNELVQLDGKRPRNAQFHRLWWAMLALMSQNSNPPMSAEQLNFMAKVATGTGEWVKNPKTGVPLFMPGSISFASMDQVAFKRFVKTSAEALCERFLPGVVPDELLAEFQELAA
jgi:hypothetical protein